MVTCQNKAFTKPKTERKMVLKVRFSNELKSRIRVHHTHITIISKRRIMPLLLFIWMSVSAGALFISADSFLFLLLFSFHFIQTLLFIGLLYFGCSLSWRRRDNCFFSLEFHCLFIVNSKKDSEIERSLNAFVHSFELQKVNKTKSCNAIKISERERQMEERVQFNSILYRVPSLCNSNAVYTQTYTCSSEFWGLGLDFSYYKQFAIVQLSLHTTKRCLPLTAAAVVVFLLLVSWIGLTGVGLIFQSWILATVLIC